MEEVSTIEPINNQFYTNAKKALLKLKNTNLDKVRFPKLELLIGGSEYFEKVFQSIRKAKKYIFCIAYTIDQSKLANQFLNELIQTLDRGVKVYILLDDLVSTADEKLCNEFITKGGVIINRNSIKKFWNVFDKSFFQRDHEKIIIFDNKFLLGSSNISSDYGGEKYGNNIFMDLNYYGKNCLVDEFSFFFEDMLFSMEGYYGINEYNFLKDLIHYKKHFNKNLYFKSNNIKLAYCNQPTNMQIQENILKAISLAKKSIKIIGPYYYPMKIFDKALIAAKERGVNIEFITAHKRDVPAYKEFTNSILFKKLLKSKINVYEYKPHFLHAKGFLFDDEYLSIGSFNTDRWSWYNNIETMIDCYAEKKLIDKYNEVFEKFKNESTIVSLKNRKPFLQKIKVGGWRVFHFLCDKFMNRGVYGYYNNLDNSLIDQMHKNISWKYD